MSKYIENIEPSCPVILEKEIIFYNRPKCKEHTHFKVCCGFKNCSYDLVIRGKIINDICTIYISTIFSIKLFENKISISDFLMYFKARTFVEWFGKSIPIEHKKSRILIGDKK